MFCSDCFNSRTRVGATRGRRKQETPYTEFQFTHPCGCDCVYTYLHCPHQVSIHAPVWVRPPLCPLPKQAGEFQFTHPCGCDSMVLIANKVPIGFNSRTRVGATSPPLNPILKQWFQFTHPCGCDPCPGECTCTPLSFNSRTRVGATLRFGHVPTMAQSFNSRTRVGATAAEVGQGLDNRVSIHAPVWVRPLPSSTSPPSQGFQFTHPCGCDGRKNRQPPDVTGFNSRTRVGATLHDGFEGDI